VWEPHGVSRHLYTVELTLRHVSTLVTPATIRMLTAYVEDMGIAAATPVMGTAVSPVDGPHVPLGSGQRAANPVRDRDFGPGPVREPDGVGRHRAAAEQTIRHVGAPVAPVLVRTLAAHVEDVRGAAAALVMGPGVGPVDIGRPRLPGGNEQERNQGKSNSGHRVGSEVCPNCNHGSTSLCNQA